MAYIDETGNRYGKLTAIKTAGVDATNGVFFWECKCDCGNTTVVRGNDLRRGKTQSCGCMIGVRHGHAGRNRSGTYRTWRCMRERCKNPNHKSYHRYGGRRIGVCSRWDIFENFHEDMGDRPVGKTIDRINPDGNYEPHNCRWATVSEQNKNRSKKKTPKKQ